MLLSVWVSVHALLCMSVWVSSLFLLFPLTNIQVGLSDYIKVPKGVNVCVHDAL